MPTIDEAFERARRKLLDLQVELFAIHLERDLAELSKPDAKILPFKPRKADL